MKIVNGIAGGIESAGGDEALPVLSRCKVNIVSVITPGTPVNKESG